MSGCAQPPLGPRLSSIPDSRTTIGEPLLLPFEVGHPLPASVAITATSGNPGVVTDDGLVVSGEGSERTLTLTPTDFGLGSAVIEVSAVDPDRSRDEISFNLDVEAPFEEREVLPNEEAADGTDYGRALAVSGNFVFVGADYAEGDVPGSGAVYVYELTADGWRFEAKLTASSGHFGQRFGRAVDAAGDTVIVGAPNEDSFLESSGAVYLFERTAVGWIEQAKLIAADADEFAYFGSAVGIDGDYVVVGAPGDDQLAARSGAIYFFERRGSGWGQVDKFVRSDGGYYDQFGAQVAIDDNWAATATFPNPSNGRENGSAHLYERQEGAWVEATSLGANEAGETDGFGLSLDLDQGRLAVSDRDTNTIYVFEEGAGGWQSNGQVMAEGLIDGHVFGEDLALNGAYLAVAATGYDADEFEDTGTVYVYRRGQFEWAEVARLMGSNDGEYHIFGWAVALDGGLLVTSTESMDSKEVAFVYRR